MKRIPALLRTDKPGVFVCGICCAEIKSYRLEGEVCRPRFCANCGHLLMIYTREGRPM